VRELIDDELATLVRERLDARRPRRLPARFVPPRPQPAHRARWTVAVVVAFLAGLAIMLMVRPEVGSTILSGLLGRQPVATPTPAPSSSAPGQSGGPTAPGSQTGAGATPVPPPGTTQATPAGGGPAPGGGTSSSAPAPQPSGGTVQLPLPPLPLPTPSGGVPLPAPSLPALPLPTPSGGLTLP
jgi:hypothetical protein